MKITLEPAGLFPPTDQQAANMREKLMAAWVAVGATPPVVKPGGSLTAWFDPTTGDVSFFEGVNAVPFRMRHSIVSETAPSNPVNGLQWLNSSDGGIYTWYNDVWIAGDAALPFGVNDLLALLRASLVSNDPPANPTNGTQWFRTSDGYIYTWYDNAWVAGEMAMTPEMEALWAEMQTKATLKTPIITIEDDASVLAPAHADSYLRFTSTSAKTYTLLANPDVVVGTAITLRNANTAELTVEAELGVTLNVDGAADVVPPKGNVQLLKVADDPDEWDLI